MSKSSSPGVPFEARELIVLALGGNALSPPGGVREDYAEERAIVARTGRALGGLIDRGYRLLIVHGNGPQVGRLQRADPARANLDIHIAQTQGELGYLLTASVPELVCVLTRVVVEVPTADAVKPVGPILEHPPGDGSPAVRAGGGWRIVVPSPRPVAVVERDLIAHLARSHHLVAGGGGGIPVDDAGEPVVGVVDKDWTAGLLAAELDARSLVFATDVEAVYDNMVSDDRRARSELTCEEAQAMVDSGQAPAGSMGPKLEGAIRFAQATGRSARICHLDQIDEALAGRAGTRVVA